MNHRPQPACWANARHLRSVSHTCASVPCAGGRDRLCSPKASSKAGSRLAPVLTMTFRSPFSCNYRFWPLLAGTLALGWGCGGASKSDAGAGVAGSSAQAGRGGDSAASGTSASSVAGSNAGGGGSGGSSSAGGTTTSAGGATASGGVSMAGAPCTFLKPECPAPQTPCNALGAVQDCFHMQVCQSTPGQVVCCDSGWQKGTECPGAGGAAGQGGAGPDGCGDCRQSNQQICVYQVGGPGGGHHVCAKQIPCGAAGLCACIVDQGTCSVGAGVAPCICDNGLD